MFRSKLREEVNYLADKVRELESRLSSLQLDGPALAGRRGPVWATVSDFKRLLEKLGLELIYEPSKRTLRRHEDGKNY